MPQILAPSADLRVRMEEGGGVKTKTKRERERAMNHYLKFVYSQQNGEVGKVVVPVVEGAVDEDVVDGEGVHEEEETGTKEPVDYKKFVQGELDNGAMTELDIFNLFKE
jgi:hypothetical protein